VRSVVQLQPCLLTVPRLAAQEVLRWILQMKEHVGTNFTDKDVSDYLWSTLKSGRVVPGYGHAVLRKPDPRFEALMDYASSRPEIAKDPVFQLVKKNSEIAPEVLKEHGKTKARCSPPNLFAPFCSITLRSLCFL
jgi:citrate synthase